jgi:cytochrome bd-type quinol oxidase subunit 2
LVVTVLGALWAGFRTGGSWQGSWDLFRQGVSLSAALGGAFFAFVLAVAVGDDLRRNWGRPQRTLAWNPLLIWKVFLSGGAVMFMLFAWFSWEQDHVLPISLSFVAFSVFSLVVAIKCFPAE